MVPFLSLFLHFFPPPYTYLIIMNAYRWTNAYHLSPRLSWTDLSIQGPPGFAFASLGLFSSFHRFSAGSAVSVFLSSYFGGLQLRRVPRWRYRRRGSRAIRAVVPMQFYGQTLRGVGRS